MRCPSLTELPPPPPNKTNWPWTEESPHLPDTMPDGSSWPCVSIVTPSYNQGHFIEETLRSVLLQGYPNLEYVVIDGGSTDGSVDVIRKYEPWLTYWVSESDQGQSDAINKGFAHTTGDVLDWLNSDDRFHPGAIQAAVKFFLQHPEVAVVYGDYNEINEYGEVEARYKAPDFDLHRQIGHNLIPQPAAFFRRIVWEQVGPLNTKLQYVMDHDLWTRTALHFPVVHIPFLMADMRFHSASKTVEQTVCFPQELDRFFDEFFALPDLPSQIRALEPQARGANYFVMGRRYLKAYQRQEARHAFECAWRTFPLHPYKLIILPFWLDTVLGTNIGMSLFRLAVWLKNGRYSERVM